MEERSIERFEREDRLEDGFEDGFEVAGSYNLKVPAIQVGDVGLAGSGTDVLEAMVKIVCHYSSKYEDIEEEDIIFEDFEV